MAKLFMILGYKIVSGGGKGSQIKLEKDNCPTIIIPGHKELKRGMELNLRKTLKKLGGKKHEIPF